jgi:hypothetical protein
MMLDAGYWIKNKKPIAITTGSIIDRVYALFRPIVCPYWLLFSIQRPETRINYFNSQIKEWIHFKYLLSDRINRMNRVFSRFPGDAVKIASACRRKLGSHMNEIHDAPVYLLIVLSTEP